ncbi:MAG TPA: hypothetical protein VKB84_18620 [Candidatus Binataceae bacterium]|nr:hypothetical protein [Candidatus Binataceae bacterium]
MNRCPLRFAATVTIGVAAALLITWSAMTVSNAYSQSMAAMNDSFNRGLSAVYLLDDVRNNVDRISIDQRAFLSTTDLRFLDGVWSSALNLDRHLEAISALAGTDGEQRAGAARLSGATRQVLECVARSYDIRDVRGSRAALAFFDAHEDVISEAKAQADQLKIGIVLNISDRIANAGGRGGLLKAMLRSIPAEAAFGSVPNARLAFGVLR